MNRILLTLLMVATHIVTLAQLPDYVPTEGLLLYAPLDESGFDFSDSLNHGTIEGPLFEPTPDGVESVYFEGTGRVNFGDVTGIGGDEVSISLKFYPTLDDSYGSAYQYIPLVSKWVTGSLGPTQNSFLCAVDDGNIRLWIAQEESESSQTLTLCPMPALFEWHHLVITFDSGIVTSFLDGELVYSNDYSSFSSVITDAFSDLLLGDWYQQYSSNYSGFTGHMRDFGVWDESLTIDEVLALNGAAVGCVDSTACNYDDGAEIDDDSCTWGCEYCGEGTAWDSTLLACVNIAPPCTPLCGIGTVWNPEVGECVIAVPADTDFDGCVTAGDVLNLLAAFGTCPPVPEWPDVEDEAPSASIDCADSVLYHGHYYQTVVIGEQCWFAENLRTTQYNEPDPDTPLQVVQPFEWASVNGEGLWDGVACVNPMALDTSLGLLYNHHAVFGNGNVCPTDWRVPTTIDWAILEMELGGSADEVGGVIGWRAYGVGEALKASPEGGCCSEFGWDGSGVSGFDAVPSGSIHPTGEFANTNKAFFWTSDTWSSSHGWRRKLGGGVSAIMNEFFFMDGGMSVRCVKY